MVNKQMKKDCGRVMACGRVLFLHTKGSKLRELLLVGEDRTELGGQQCKTDS